MVATAAGGAKGVSGVRAARATLKSF